MRHALWYGHGSFMGLQIHALPTRIENTFPTITFYSLNYRSTLFRIHIAKSSENGIVAEASLFHVRFYSLPLCICSPLYL